MMIEIFFLVSLAINSLFVQRVDKQKNLRRFPLAYTDRFVNDTRTTERQVTESSQSPKEFHLTGSFSAFYSLAYSI